MPGFILSPDLCAWLTRDGRALAPYTAERASSPESIADDLADLLHCTRAAPVAVVAYRRTLLRALEATGTRRLLDAPLAHVVDLSGAYLPAPGVPTVVLLSGPVEGDTLRALRCDHFEPETPAGAYGDRVWRAIISTWDTAGATDWTTTADVLRGAGALRAFLRGGPLAAWHDASPSDRAKAGRAP